MKTSLFAAAVAMAVMTSLSTQTHAQDSALTRAEVKAEFLRARAAGELPSSADLFGPALMQALTQAMRTSAKTPAMQATMKAPEAQPPQVVAAPQPASAPR